MGLIGFSLPISSPKPATSTLTLLRKSSLPYRACLLRNSLPTVFRWGLTVVFL